MKLQKYIFGALSAAVLGMGMTSCSESFLDEELINQQSTDYFKSEKGLDDLITGTYSALKFKFNYSWGYMIWPMGTDEFDDANNEIPYWNGYMATASEPSNSNACSPLWDNMYNRIQSANVAIQYIPKYYTGAKKDVRLGEAYFLRAFCYFQLVQQFGGVPLNLTPDATEGSLSSEFTRASVEDCYKQIIGDFEVAHSLLKETPEATGRITKFAAAHFIAKAKLFRQSEINASWNAKYKDSDLEDVIKKGIEVLDAHPLCDDYVDLWDYRQADGANEKVPEVVLAAQFSNDGAATRGRFGNQMHLAYPAVYQDMPGTKRDISGDREFCYLRTTNYTLDVFDRVNDSRFWKSFITTYGCNDKNGAAKWVEPANGSLPAGAVVGQPRFGAGQLATKYIVNNAGDTEYENMGVEGQVLRNGVMEAPNTMVRYFKGETENWTSGHGNYGNYAQKKRFVALSKYRDGNRDAIASQFGTRDGIIARSAEDVLFIAEAYARQGNWGECIKYINKLRKRAAYKPGDDRAHHVDGGQAYVQNPACANKGGGLSADGAIFYPTNTYFESNKLEGQEAAINATGTEAQLLINGLDDILNSPIDNKIYNALTDKSNFGSDVTFSKVMNFILNERTRELCGEMQRWIDLARCKALKGRWEAFNDGCGRQGKSKFEEYMYYRPIPQNYIDALTNAGAAAQQNPGY